MGKAPSGFEKKIQSFRGRRSGTGLTDQGGAIVAGEMFVSWTMVMSAAGVMAVVVAVIVRMIMPVFVTVAMVVAVIVAAAIVM
ncbi:MAG: hypothetical protein RIR26_2748 [Pseudomonadota bacterium]